MFKESTLAVAARILMAGSRAALTILIANFLGPAVQGVFSLALAVVTVATLLGSAGLEIAYARYAGQYPQKARVLLTHALVTGLASGFLIASGTLAVLTAFSAGYFRHFPPAFLWSIPVAVFGQVLQLYFGAIVVGRMEFTGYFWITAAQYGLIPLSILGLASGHLLDAEWLMPIWAAGVWSGTLVAFGYAWRLSRGQSWAMDWSLLKAQLAFSKNAYLNNLANWLNYRLDLFIVAAFLDPVFVGWYSVSTTLAEVLLYIPKGLGTVALARQAGSGPQSRVVSLYKATELLVGVAAVGLFFLAPVLIPLLMSREFLPAVPSFRLLLPGVLALSIAIIASNQLFGGGESRVPSRGAVLALVATVGLDLLLIPSLGIEGAALASSIAYIIYAVYLLRAVSAQNECRMYDLLVFSRADWNVFTRIAKAYLQGRREIG